MVSINRFFDDKLIVDGTLKMSLFDFPSNFLNRKEKLSYITKIFLKN